MRKIKEFAAGARAVRWLNWAMGALAVLCLPFAYQVLIEWIRMGSVTACLEYVRSHLGVMLIGWVMLVLAFAALAFATARPWAAGLVFGALLVLAGCVNYFKLVYRADPLLPQDMVQAKEAWQISGEMSLSLTREMWAAVAFWAVSTLVLLPFRLPLAPGWKSVAARVVTPAVCVACMPLYLFFYMGDKQAMAGRGVEMHPISIADSFYRGSFVTSFLYLSANTRQTPPAGYDKNAMWQLAEELPQENGSRTPDIIVVLLESFYDVTAIEGTRYSEELMPNYARLAAEGVSGQMVSGKRGGGTSDLEFSVLTGFSTQLLPQGSVPMIEYVPAEMQSLPRYCAQNGYRTVAVHPYIRSFYNRPAAYKSMQIQEYYSLEDFGEGLEVGSYVSDDALADRVIAEYEKSAGKGENVFIHAVTMQNHMPYTAGSYPAEYAVQADSGMGEAYDGFLSTYATGVRDEDAMMGRLCEYFRTVDRDVVLLFYGDHQSEISDDGYEDLYMATPAYQNADADAKWEMTHVTPYLMWANYARPAREAGRLAPYMLVPAMLDAFDVKGPAYYRWLAGTGFGGGVGGYYIQPDGALQAQPTAPQQEVLRRQALYQYDVLFGKQYIVEEMYA